jgi:hypothetical protein
MKQLDTISPYILSIIPLVKIFKGGKKKNNRSNPHSVELGINFANVLAGNLYPERVALIKSLRLRQKDVASHLYCVNQLY